MTFYLKCVAISPLQTDAGSSFRKISTRQAARLQRTSRKTPYRGEETLGPVMKRAHSIKRLLFTAHRLPQISAQIWSSRESPSSRSASFKHLMISLHTDLASNGGTAFPIWRLAFVLESGVKVCDIGNVCRLAASLIVYNLSPEG